MVLTKSELIGSLQNEVRILLHLAGQGRSREARLPADAEAAEHAGTAAISLDHGAGPRRGRAGGRVRPRAVDGAENSAKARDFDQTLAAIAEHTDRYAALLGGMSDADFRSEIDMFGQKTTRGAFIVNLVLCGCAAYRTQLFLYLKACGREELSTMNLWAGMDAPPAS